MVEKLGKLTAVLKGVSLVDVMAAKTVALKADQKAEMSVETKVSLSVGVMVGMLD